MKKEKRFQDAVVGQDSEIIELRAPQPADGQHLYTLTQHIGNLDLNSEYAYLLPGLHFAETSVVAEHQGKIIGFVSGYSYHWSAAEGGKLLSDEPHNTFFVWQVGVDPGYRKRGLAQKMIKSILARKICAQINYLQATVTLSNTASANLFRAMAREFNTECTETECLPAEFFSGGHEAEVLFNVGPFQNYK